MKNITLSAKAGLIEAARERARLENTTLNAEFQRWLTDYTRQEHRVEKAMEVIARLQKYVDTGGRKFSRDEMNER